MKKLALAIVATSAMGAMSSTQAATMCVFDLLGASGEAYQQMKDWALQAKSWGADVKLKAYTDERVANEDFKAGKCDGVSITAMRAREFNKFVGSIDSIGAVPNNKVAQSAISFTLNSRNAGKMVSSNKKYEVVGIAPMGSAYLFVNDRNINSVAKAAGKKIAVLDYDSAQKKMVQQIGAQPVSSDVTNFSSKFNNGQVDIIGAPAYAFKPLELHKGLGSKGAMINFPILHVTANVVINPSKFPAGFGQKSRDWFVKQLPKAFSTISKLEAGIPAKYKMNIPADDQIGYQKMMCESRIALTKQGTYDKSMMFVLKKARCSVDKSNFECSLAGE
ncbi:putative solute-binding protein [Acinetobacter sp.]|uniref:putative solute-binding protein n=1 Tax=Acinetobacter sp. TaxID=472 RepID=UPI0035B48571